ncbi:4-sulfomuconolactone hydrolase [Panicum miliaceum]|uniref:4-sulfomuconolactone hydrolase n=1 Tax=Panicum miliaceum TaxID=4540 RepID=A0A3L6Q8U9_PANMI|nr:4-sulfomuconolactone hydrolase [Panicum miliaceum]
MGIGRNDGLLGPETSRPVNSGVLHCVLTSHVPPRGAVAVAAATRSSSDDGFPVITSGCPVPVLDSHLHVWASPQQAKEGYPYFPGQEATLRGDADLLLECMDEAGVDGSLIVQPINHMFDHSLVTSGLKTQNVSNKQMTNEVGRSLFAKAGELGAPVGIMTMKEIEELCSDYPETTVILDHMAFCKPPTNDEEEKAFSSFLNLSRFPKIYVKYSALFSISREAYPYEDTAQLLSRVISNYGANRIMWGSDFPFVVPECGYKGATEAVSHATSKISVSPSDLEWILGKTVSQLFQGSWVA